MSDYLRTYMVYSRAGGPQEGAALVFAHNRQEARVMGWWHTGSGDFTDELLDFESRRLKDRPWLYAEADQEKFRQGLPHIILVPKSCKRCRRWGQSPIGEDGLCEECR